MADEHPEKLHEDANTPNQEADVSKTGWLFKRSKVSHKWEKNYFDLENDMLYYADTCPLDKVNTSKLDQNSNIAFRLKSYNLSEIL